MPGFNLQQPLGFRSQPTFPLRCVTNWQIASHNAVRCPPEQVYEFSPSKNDASTNATGASRVQTIPSLLY
jgi:hypothetical protein